MQPCNHWIKWSFFPIVLLVTLSGVYVNQSFSYLGARASAASGGGLFPVVFTESGLAPDSKWSVNISGIESSSNSSNITLQLPIGNYSYTATGPSGFAAQRGTLAVTGEVNNSFAIVSTIQMRRTPRIASYSIRKIL